MIKTAVLYARPAVRLGLRENVAQFTLLVIVNAFVGAMVGMERSILPAIAEQDFHLVARYGGVVVHRRIRRDQGAHELRRGPAGRPSRAEAGARRGLGHRDTGAIYLDVGAELELDSRGERAVGHQSGLHVVNHRDHEDRSRGQ